MAMNVNVVESRTKYLRKNGLTRIFHFTNAPTEQAGKAIPEDIEPPIQERRGKNGSFLSPRPHFNLMRTSVDKKDKNDEA